MDAPRRVGNGLLPGLSEELLEAHVLPRLPWYTRPVCRAISKSWRAFIDSCKTRPDLKLKTRAHQLPLLRGLCLLCTFDTQMFITRECANHVKSRPIYHAVQWQSHTYQIHRLWRKLPPLQDLLRQPPMRVSLIADSGMVYLWSIKKPTLVLKMDMGCGDWTWNKLSMTHGFNSLAVVFNGKIYIPRVPINGEQEVVLAHDMMTCQNEVVKSWNRDNLIVVRRRGSQSSFQGGEQMYSFEEQEFIPDERLELFLYDAVRDLWKIQDQISIPEYRWSEVLELKLLDADCFKPAPEKGTNTVWIDVEAEEISWFNPSLHSDWVDFTYNVPIKGKVLQYVQIDNGFLYGMFVGNEDEDQDNEGGENEDAHEPGSKERDRHPGLYKLTIMKGCMSVTSCDVQWEEMHVVGCFEYHYYLNPAVVSPIEHYTFMV